jgi:putative hydrolase of the HAD superfamily
MTVETVFLDAGGVLVNPNWTRVSETLGRHGVTVPAEALAAAEHPAKKVIDTGTTINATNDNSRGWLYFNLVLEHAGVAPDDRTRAALDELAQYHAEWNLWESVPAEVIPALQRLRAKGLRLAVLSNANGTLRDAFSRLRLARYFCCLFDSQEEGVEKPDPRYFHIALARTAAQKETTIHVGDLYNVDVVGARAAGLEGWLLDAGGLYPEADCPRVRSLTDLADRLHA